MKDNKHLSMVMIMAVLFLFLGIIIWILYFKLNFQLQNMTGIHANHTLVQLGISLAVTFILIVSLLAIASMNHSQSKTNLFILNHMQQINSPETSIN